MNKKNDQQIQQLYNQLKKQYNSLLEKNQNDLIKIKIKEKTLNERIATIQAEREFEVRTLKQRIEFLEEKLAKSITHCPIVPNHSENSAQINSVREALIKKEAQELKSIKEQNGQLRVLIEKLKEQLRKTQSDCNKMNKEKDEILRQNEEKLFLQIDNMKETIRLLSQNLNKTQIDSQDMKKQSSIDQITLHLRQQQFEKLTIQLEQYRRIQQAQENCEKCLELEQQLQLNREMLKSVRMMLKFKEMELQSIKTQM